MLNNEEYSRKFDFPDADIILRAMGPPTRDFRVHKLILSLASPVFECMFSLPQSTIPTSNDSRNSDMMEEDTVAVSDPADALDIILKIIYPFASPSLDGRLDTLVECLVIADKYAIEGAISHLRDTLSRADPSECLQVYAIASRFGFADIVESTFRRIVSSVNITETTPLPEDFKFVPSAHQELVKHRTKYLEVVGNAIERTPLQYSCISCPVRKHAEEEESKSKLAFLVKLGMLLMGSTCLQDWEMVFGSYECCLSDCLARFISTATENAAAALGDDFKDLYL